METGAEIGVYNRWYFGGGLTRGPVYSCWTGASMYWVKSSFVLRHGHTILLRRGPECHWWLTGFKWGVYTDDPSKDLTMDVSFEFNAPDWTSRDGRMIDRFVGALGGLGYHPVVAGNTVSFQVGRPLYRPQPATRAPLQSRMQSFNGELVSKYVTLKKQLGLRNNDPNGFDFEKAGAVAHPVVAPVVRHAVKNVRNIVRHVQPLVHGHAGLPDGAELFSAFHNKVWRGAPHA